MRRVHAWEFHEQTFVPRVVRESIVEALGRGLRWGRYYEAIAPTFAEFCSQIDGPLEAVDMCCGSGEPAAALLDALASRGLPQPSFVLTDLFPNPQATESAVARHPDLLTAHHAPVDATALPPSLDRPIRTVFNAFHHFTPELAERIIRDTIQARRA
ncbi:MAG: polypeptide subunit release factor methylase, partial [Myxococcota bacterium]